MTVHPLSRPKLWRGHVGSSGSSGGWGAVDTDRPASLLPGFELFVQSLLFGDDGSQGVGHLLDLLLVHVVELVHPLGKRPLYNVIAASVPGGSLMYHGDDFPQQRNLLVLGSGAGGRGGVGFLIFFDGVWEFTSRILTRRSLFSRYLSPPAWSRRGLLTRLAWARCSHGIRHARRGIVAVFDFAVAVFGFALIFFTPGVVSLQYSTLRWRYSASP